MRTRRWATLLSLALVAIAGSDARAADLSAAQIEPWEGSDWAWGALAGLSGTVVMGISGAWLGNQLDPGRTACAGDMCEVDQSGMIAGGLAGAYVGSFLGVWGYGELSGHEASPLWTFIGHSVGSLSGLGLAFVGFEEDEGGLFALGIVLPTLGALVGYAASAKEPRHRRYESWSLAPPSISLAREDGGVRVHASLLSGTF